jgi:tetratricopeptide (TPR) repeat protein
MSRAQIVVIALVVLPALAVVCWPLFRPRRGEEGEASAPRRDEKRLELGEEKASIYRALKELEFDHEAGHLSDDDYGAIRNRYESRAAQVLAALDAMPAARAPRGAKDTAEGGKPATTAPGWTRHPMVLTAGAVLVLVFGVLLGLNVGRFTAPDQPAASPGGGMPVVGGGSAMPPVAGLEPGKPIPPEVMKAMLQAARESLFAGQYQPAIAAYQAVLKRDPKNVDAMTHLALIVAIGGHGDAALETFDKALKIDAKYAPAYLYRGQVLYETKQDYPGAVKAWERYLALVPTGEDHDRVVGLIKEARSKQPAR